MGETTRADGPDLALGIREDALQACTPLSGHVAGEPVLLIRLDDEVHAISGACTHYGAPLHEGLLTGDEIRCPWHHACFSVRTGSVIAEPALQPLSKWRVERRDGSIYVTGREETSAVQTRGATVNAVVIVGGGAAGTAAVETLRREGYEGAITVIDADADAPYDRPNLSKDFLAGNAPEEWLPLRDSSYYDALGITRVHGRATAIDAARHSVTLDDGRELSFDALLLATGATPVRPRIPGADLPHVHVLRSLADCRGLIAALTPSTHVVIAGASFIGLEAAASLRARGCAVTVAAPELIPFARVLGPTIGTHLKQLHESNGVVFQLGHSIAGITADHVLLDDGSRLACDVVLLGIGVRPSLDLATEAGLRTDNGVIVDSYMQTSAPGIYAAGDIARYPDPWSGEHIRIEHWAVAERQGSAAARNMLGMSVPFRSVPFFWTRQYDLAVNYVGHATDWTRIDIDGDPATGDYSATFKQLDRTLAHLTIGRDRESLVAERELEQQIA